MAEYFYQICFLGEKSPSRKKIRDGLENAMREIGIPQKAVKFFEDGDCLKRDRKAATAAAFFGSSQASSLNSPELNSLLEDTISVLPLVPDIAEYRNAVPDRLHEINGLQCSTNEEISKSVSIILENLHLLRNERRVFLSYKRDESTGVAEQLYDELSKRGFDCFLDTRSVRPSDNFQNELWHRLADSDIVVLLDTPRFRSSHWTVQELTQANSTSVQILHLLWPNVDPDHTSAFSDFVSLNGSSFKYLTDYPDKTSTLTDNMVSTLVDRLESLRARAIAARHAELSDSVSDTAKDVGLSVDIQPQRYLTLEIGAKRFANMPTVGVPSSPRLHNFAKQLETTQDSQELIALYDERGILDGWRDHLTWLSQHLPVKTLENGKVPQWLLEAKKI